MDIVLAYWPHFTLVAGSIGLLLTLPSIVGSKKAVFHYWYLPLFLYMVHMFEEHGIDLLGRHFAFQAGLCAILKKASGSETCAATELVIFVVNCGTVVILMVCAGLWRHTEKFTLLKAGAVGGILINGVSHVVKAKETGYDPGLLTAVLFFLPCSFWLMYMESKRNNFVKVFLLSIIMGLQLHGVLVFSLVLSMKGYFDASLLPIIQIVNGFIPLLLTIAQGEGSAIFEQKTKIV